MKITNPSGASITTQAKGVPKIAAISVEELDTKNATAPEIAKAIDMKL